ncbi:MAG: ATP-dependent sacrificial sulfur transferase LarE [Parasporobacterium sp.]|nr:ATP-dependent sacrificial sulfur transferase LarE [Parasporobacterium sp.]
MTLQEFFAANPKVAVGFSGGVDSAYLLYMAKQYAKEVKAYYVKSCFQPEFELEDATRLAEEIGAELKILNVSVLDDPVVRSNPPDRCYYCKQKIFGTILAAAKEDGFPVLLDGTNASDQEADRPGFRALKELSVLSPLREAGLTKEEIRMRSKEAGLFTWNKPAYACLATRIAANETITEESLAATERAEMFLFGLGFTDIRVRSMNGHARIEVPEREIVRAVENRKLITETLRNDFKTVSLDLEERERKR